MPSVTGFTADRSRQIEDNQVTSAYLNDGRLILKRYDNSELDAGFVGSGSGLKPRGAWNAGTAYAISDLVTHSGSSWIASVATSPGQQPGVHSAWQEFAVQDIKSGTHNITGNITFTSAGPVVPPATHDGMAANLGDVKTQIAQESLLLPSDGPGETLIDLEDDGGDLRLAPHPILARGYAMNPRWAGLVSTTAESRITSYDGITATLLNSFQIFAGSILTNTTEWEIDLAGTMLNNTGQSRTITVRLIAEKPNATRVILASDVITLPSNAAARPFFFNYKMSFAQFFNLQIHTMAHHKVFAGSSGLAVIEDASKTSHTDPWNLATETVNVYATAQLSFSGTPLRIDTFSAHATRYQ